MLTAQPAAWEEGSGGPFLCRWTQSQPGEAHPGQAQSSKPPGGLGLGSPRQRQSPPTLGSKRSLLPETGLSSKLLAAPCVERGGGRRVLFMLRGPRPLSPPLLSCLAFGFRVFGCLLPLVWASSGADSGSSGTGAGGWLLKGLQSCFPPRVPLSLQAPWPRGWVCTSLGINPGGPTLGLSSVRKDFGPIPELQGQSLVSGTEEPPAGVPFHPGALGCERCSRAEQGPHCLAGGRSVVLAGLPSQLPLGGGGGGEVTWNQGLYRWSREVLRPD